MKSEADSEPDSEYDSDCEQQLVHIRDWQRFLRKLKGRRLQLIFNEQQLVHIRDWQRFLRKLKGIRRLQLIFNATGCALKDHCPEVRQRVSNIYKIE